MQWHDLGRVIRHGVDFRALFDEQPRGFRLPEIAGEMQGREAVFRERVDGIGIAQAALEPFQTAKGGGLEDVEFLFLARNCLGQVAAAAIKGVHQQADTGGISCFGSVRGLVKQAAEPVGVSGLKKFKTALRLIHTRPSPVIT